MATANAMGTAVMLCTLAMAIGASCLAIKEARSKYRHYIMGSTTHPLMDDDAAASAAEAADGTAAAEAAAEQQQQQQQIITVYPAFPQKKNVEECDLRGDASSSSAASQRLGSISS